MLLIYVSKQNRRDFKGVELEPKNIYSRVIDRCDLSTHRKIGLKVFFLAQKDDISDALNRGLTISSVWELLHDEGLFDGTYKTFCKYVALYITDKKSTTVKQQTQIPTPQQPRTIGKDKPTTTGFDWSPNYNEDDLF